MKFKFNFSDPMLLSKGEEQDVFLLKLKDPGMFVSKDTLLPLTEEQGTFIYRVPKQLPSHVQEADLLSSARKLQSSIEGFVILLVILMVFLQIDLQALI